MSTRGKPRPKAYLSIGEYLRKGGAFKTVNIYYNDIISTHPSVALSENGDDEEVDELTHAMINAAKHGHIEKLRFLAGEAQKGRKVGGVGTCIGERVTSLMLHLAAENGYEAIVHYLVEELWVDIDAATVRGMTALHYAAKANRTAVVRELARLGADLEARNDSGQVPAQLTKDRLLRRLFQQYLGGSSLSGAPMVDRFVLPLTASSRIVDYVVVMTVKLTPQLEVDSDKLSDVRQAMVSEIWRYPKEDHEDTPMPSPSNLAEMCTQNCHNESGPLASYGTLLTDMSGRRSHVFSKVLGVFQDAAQKGRAKVHAALGPSEPSLSGGSCAAGELSARLVLVLSRYPYTAAFAAVCEHVAELVLEEAPKWGSLGEWPLAMEHDRNAQMKFAVEFYATELKLPLPSQVAEIEVLGRTLAYGDPHASHSGLPHLEEADLRCLFSRLGSDKVLTALSCLLQEQSVLILSDKLEDLGPVSAALLGLLFPMQWPHTVIPVLPVSLVHYLEAPVPFVMGMDASALGRVTADLSCITIVNLVSGKLILPIRPITSVSSELPSAADGGDASSGAHRRPSRRDSTTRALAELPIGLRRQTERRLRRCVPLEIAPASDRSNSQPRASKFYTPGLRVATIDLMVALVGSYQTYRYAPGAQKRVIFEAPEDHRRILEAIFTSQLWCSFRDDLLSEEGEGGGEWEAQAQLFCACVERAQHSDKGGSNARVESNSCKDVLYPSEDVEEQLALLSVYPALDATVEGPPSPQGSDAAGEEDGINAEGLNGVDGAIVESALAGDLDLQGKTDEVIRSITSSFVAVTDMFGATDESGSGVTPVRQAEVSPTTERRQERSQSESGWDLFKRQPMSEVKRRLDEMRLGDGASSSLTPEKSGTERVDGRAKGSFGARMSSSLSPARRFDGGSEVAGGGALGAFGESLKEWRRRSTEAMSGAVSKLKNALDDADEDGSEMQWGGKGTKSRASESDWRVRAAAANARRPPEAGGDPFWNPFGEKKDREDKKSGGDVSEDDDDEDDDDDDDGEDEEDEPVPLPEPGEARAKHSDSAQPASVRNRLHTFYGAGAR